MPLFHLHPALPFPAIIVTGGQAPVSCFVHELAGQAQAIYAADSGLYHLEALGLRPDKWLGDQDSYRQKLPTGIETLTYAQDKDASDTELAMVEAIRDGWEQIGIIAGRGSRMDHTLANMLLLARYPLRVFMLDPGQWLTVVNAGHSLDLTGFCGYTLSLLPLGEKVAGIELTGTKWPLTRAELAPGSQGLSNIIVQDQVRLSLQQGMLWLAVTDPDLVAHD